MAKKEKISENLWIKITGVIVTVCTLIGSGYAAGVYQEQIQCNLDKNVLLTDYQSKLREELNKQKQCEIENYNTNNAALLNLINVIKNDSSKQK